MASVPKEVVLFGLKERGSRFGFAIAAAGDLNNDFYNDLVVGAPSTVDGDGMYICFGVECAVYYIAFHRIYKIVRSHF